MKKLLALMLVAILMFSFAACSQDAEKSDLETIEENGKIVVGITEYAPMDYKENGKWVGFDAEFAQAVAKKLGVEVEFKVIDWDNKFLALKSGDIDCIWNGMTITDQVKNSCDVSKAYARNKQVVVMNKDAVDKYKDEKSLKGIKIAVESGSAAETVAKDKGFDYVAVKAQTDALLEVKSGSTEACIIDITMADTMTGKGTSYENLAKGLVLTDEEYGIGFRKGSDLTSKVNDIFDELMKDGTMEKISKKYKVELIK